MTNPFPKGNQHWKKRKTKPTPYKRFRPELTAKARRIYRSLVADAGGEDKLTTDQKLLLSKRAELAALPPANVVEASTQYNALTRATRDERENGSESIFGPNKRFPGAPNIPFPDGKDKDKDEQYRTMWEQHFHAEANYLNASIKVAMAHLLSLPPKERHRPLTQAEMDEIAAISPSHAKLVSLINRRRN